MLALTVRQPWAYAIVAGLKSVENRTWSTTVRGRVAIHAALSREDTTDVFPDGTPVDADALAYGSIIGTVEIVDCVRASACKGDVWAEGPWCFVLANPVLFAQPVACKGSLAFWRTPDAIAEAMTKAVAVVTP